VEQHFIANFRGPCTVCGVTVYSNPDHLCIRRLSWWLFVMAITKMMHRWKGTSGWAGDKAAKMRAASDVGVPSPLPPITESAALTSSSNMASDAPAVPAANANVFLVPSGLVARSHPSRHSVPIVRDNLVLAFLIALVPLIGLVLGIYYSADATRSAGYHLECSVVGVGEYARTDCVWKK
jgi:hypothetical protein